MLSVSTPPMALIPVFPLPLEVMAVELRWDSQDAVIDGCHFP